MAAIVSYTKLSRAPVALGIPRVDQLTDLREIHHITLNSTVVVFVSKVNCIVPVYLNFPCPFLAYLYYSPSVA